MNESRLYNFIDEEYYFNIHFLEGQKLIADLVSNNQLQGETLEFFRSIVLSFTPLITFLKDKEHLGIYLDSEKPYFRFKLESNYQGYLRTLITPEQLTHLPGHYSGVCRLIKSVENQSPYTSMVEINNLDLKNIVNTLLKDSYQFEALVFISEKSDQSIIVNKLPVSRLTNPKQNLSAKEYLLKFQNQFNTLFEKYFHEESQILNFFSGVNYKYIGSKKLLLFCPCSKEKMIDNLRILPPADLQEVFEDSKIEVKCDYCKKNYIINRQEVINH